MTWRKAVRYWLAAALVVSAAPAAQAGIFDSLARAIFGPQRLRAVPIYEQEAPVPRAPRPRAPEVSSKPKPPVVQLDPATDPHWYLRDPTLRRGDIVVTATGVLVYQGRDSDTIRPADFTALGGSDAKGWKQQLHAAAAGGRNVFGGGNSRTETVSAAQPEPRQNSAIRR